MTRYRVTDNTQVNVDGTIHTGGDTFDADPADVTDLLASEWITEDTPAPKRKRA